MIRTILIILYIVFAWNLTALSQDYSYTHYDIADGLAGSAVYCITQDKDGFIWVGTETGVSRFDGTHFINFTNRDGLPDIEILQMFGDSRGRVWMAPFRKSICYYYKGSIHNQENDSLLRTIRLVNNIEGFAEDAQGNILLHERSALHLITKEGSVIRYDSIGGKPVEGCVAVCRSSSGNFLAQINQRIIEFSRKGVIRSIPIQFADFSPNYIALNPWWGVWRQNRVQTTFLSFSNNKKISLPFKEKGYKHISFSLVDDSLAFINEFSGTREWNLHTGKIKHMLAGEQVSRVFRDDTGNLWFTTLNKGIFRLNSDEFRTIGLPMRDGGRSTVCSIARIGNDLWVGGNRNCEFDFSLPDLVLKNATPSNDVGKNRILFMDTAGPSNVVVGSEYAILKKNRRMKYLEILYAGVKSIAPIDDHHWLVGTNTGAYIFDPVAFRLTDTLCRERTTVVFYAKDTFYYGTLNGLYRLTAGKGAEYMGARLPLLRKRISSLARSPDGTLWIASYDDAGIIGYRKDSVVARITQLHGLTSGICRKLVVCNDQLWVGTDKGLNRIDLDKPNYPVTRYTANDGLGSDLINTVFVQGAMVYVGTPAGLSYFDESKTNIGESCRLYLMALINSGRDRLADSANLVLPYNDKRVRFEFAGISYRSVGGIRYRYRLLGLDSIWRETNETYLEYPTLPSGHYRFQLQAENKFAIRSSLLSVPFAVATPYWQTAWFEVVILLTFIALTWLLVSRRIRNIRRQQDERERLMRKSTEMENRALQAQMNPHFIFNCLNSIQQFVFDRDIMASNQYISGFANLIRATLNNSTKSFISISDEVDYLSTYLSLEKMRFKEKMNYTIEVDTAIDKDSRFLPPMLIQPYVENSIRHGLRHKMQGQGHIRIMMRQLGTQLVVVIEDNGIGRKKAQEYKSIEHIEYQSKGMALTADRIKMISLIYGCEINVSIEDTVAENGQTQGTRVIMHLPDF